MPFEASIQDNRRIWFGKHRGSAWITILYSDPTYVWWALTKKIVRIKQFSPQFITALKERLDRKAARANFSIRARNRYNGWVDDRVILKRYQLPTE